MEKIQNEYCDETNEIIKAKIIKYDGHHIYFKQENQEEKNWAETTLDKIPKNDKIYNLYIYKGSFGWFLNGFEPIKETIKNIHNNTQYKSNGELQIAKFLDELNVKFEYEKKFLIKDKQNYERIAYPDFWLIEYGIIIEYFGMKGNKEYDKITKLKEESYFKERLEYISIYPKMIKNNSYKMNIINDIQFIINKKKEKFEKSKDNYLQKLMIK